MAFASFIPEVWSARLLAHLEKAHVYAPLLNRDYEGEIRAYGDTVHINQITAGTIRDYDGSDIADPDNLDAAQVDLVVNRGKYFNFQIKDIDNAQSQPKLMEEAIRQRAYELNDEIDQVLGQILAGGVESGSTLGSIASPVVPTASTAYEKLVDLGTILGENNVPMYDRWAVVPPWFYGLLLKDSRFVGNGTDYNKAILEGGQVGAAAGFSIYVSNNVPAGYKLTTDQSVNSAHTYYTVDSAGVFTKVGTPAAASLSTYYEKQSSYQLLAGTNAAGSFAEQLVELEAYRREKNFADGVKGLHVFGAKVVQPKALACLICAKS